MTSEVKFCLPSNFYPSSIVVSQARAHINYKIKGLARETRSIVFLQNVFRQQSTEVVQAYVCETLA